MNEQQPKTSPKEIFAQAQQEIVGELKTAGNEGASLFTVLESKKEFTVDIGSNEKVMIFFERFRKASRMALGRSITDEKWFAYNDKLWESDITGNTIHCRPVALSVKLMETRGII